MKNLILITLLVLIGSIASARTSLYFEPIYELTTHDQFYYLGVEGEYELKKDVKYIGFLGPFVSNMADPEAVEQKWIMMRHGVNFKVSERVTIEPTYWFKAQDTGFRQNFIHVKVLIDL